MAVDPIGAPTPATTTDTPAGTTATGSDVAAFDSAMTQTGTTGPSPSGTSPVPGDTSATTTPPTISATQPAGSTTTTIPAPALPTTTLPSGETQPTITDADRRGEINSRRTDGRIREDSRWRREPGGNRGDGHLSNDWAGRTILGRYMTGGGDLTIQNDPRWTEYMQESPVLTSNLQNLAIETAQNAVADGSGTSSFNETIQMNMENGEGIVGHQYLHGTNANAGGFERSGDVTVTPDGSGGHYVDINFDYTWNDVIDPNGQYTTDTVKSTFAEIITLGQADPYEIHISWSENTRVHLDSNGQPISIENRD